MVGPNGIIRVLSTPDGAQVTSVNRRLIGSVSESFPVADHHR